MSTEHVALADPNIHEPKGISVANAGTVYVSNGLGTGSWQKVDYSLTYIIEDASTASSEWIVIPFTSKLIAVYATVNSTFSMDQTIIFELATIPMTGGTLSLLSSGSAAGDIFSCRPTAVNTVNAGDVIEMVNAGGSASPFKVTLTFVFSTQ